MEWRADGEKDEVERREYGEERGYRERRRER